MGPKNSKKKRVSKGKKDLKKFLKVVNKEPREFAISSKKINSCLTRKKTDPSPRIK